MRTLNRYLVSGSYGHLHTRKLVGNLDRDFDNCKPIIVPHIPYQVYIAETEAHAIKQRRIDIIAELLTEVKEDGKERD